MAECLISILSDVKGRTRLMDGKAIFSSQLYFPCRTTSSSLHGSERTAQGSGDRHSFILDPDEANMGTTQGEYQAPCTALSYAHT